VLQFKDITWVESKTSRTIIIFATKIQVQFIIDYMIIYDMQYYVGILQTKEL